ncbi:class II fumarate hydratase [Salinispira pacifica]|uniref:Fumarate hydratase class II n=1 Tax=Salinispira pacifica TaxID=1307761 RepID=V5WKP3_9SPIO|nr:class II fumarate hydratase [Salinispira pacifica]AHC16215.1 Fumarate hydratase class II [Salinispira pacifica]
MEKTRSESDSMGNIEIPGWAYWGAQTQRAVENFQISGKTLPVPMIRAIALIKKHAAQANARLGLVDEALSKAIVQAADEVIRGEWDEHFPIDVFQTGSGTSSNMNTNEVISNRANEILGEPIGLRKPVHPNDHVNRGQSSNDVIPTAVHISNRIEAEQLLLALNDLGSALEEKAEEFSSVLKLGRTHLQDAVPMSLGQEFSAYAVQIRKAETRIRKTFENLEELPLGGTAIGTGLNTHKDFARLAVDGIAEESSIPFRPAANSFEGIAARDAQVEFMGALNVLATSLMKIGNDLRILASGPRGALGEIVLPSLQPGSSIMPGKVNPVIPEMLIQVAAFVHGKVTSVTMGGQNAPLELNMMNPMISYEVLTSIEVLSNACRTLANKGIRGMQADEERCRHWIDWSLAMVTPLALKIGYDSATKLAYKAFKEKKKIRDVVLGEGILSETELDTILDPRGMISNRD